jgi:hypothetical protein
MLLSKMYHPMNKHTHPMLKYLDKSHTQRESCETPDVQFWTLDVQISTRKSLPMYLPMYNKALPMHQVKISIPEENLSRITPFSLGRFSKSVSIPNPVCRCENTFKNRCRNSLGNLTRRSKRHMRRGIIFFDFFFAWTRRVVAKNWL